MNVILLTFANSQKEPLETLAEEDREVYKLLSDKAIEEKDWHIQHIPNATIRELTEDLDKFLDSITVFLYSGHAGKNELFTQDEAANAEGIAALLGQCPNLKLVILNGCSTQGQVEGLLAAGIPCVIATSAPIEDFSATQFSITFFKSMAKRGKNIEKAYEEALAVAQTFSSKSIKAKRGLLKRNAKPNTPLWGLFHPEGQAINLEWTLTPEPIADKTFVPNELLLAKIWEAIAPYVSEPDKNYNRPDKIEKIITELPHPISEYLRKLIAKSMPGEKKEIFYNELSVKRLKYLVYTYTTCVELITFTLLAQIWDELVKGKIKQIPADLKGSLATLFSMSSQERRTYGFITLIQQMRNCLKEQKIAFFIQEYQTLSKVFQEDTEFYEAYTIIEEIKKDVFADEKMPDATAQQLCIPLEKELSKIMSHLGFLAKYKMTSMKDIHFIKQKHQVNPQYKLNFVELRIRFSGMDVISETLSDSMDNASVILLNPEGKSTTYLNLSPFIIDHNSFDENATVANLCVFQSFEKVAKVFTFRYIYQPFDRPLVVRKSIDYFDKIADQFNAFHELLFNKKLIEYEKAAA